jgi:SAM-dependent methyltransferase
VPALELARENKNVTEADAPRPDWDDSYAGPPPPWDIGRPQPAFVRLAEAGTFTGALLDAGCGTGEHTVLAARHGARVIGIDVSPRTLTAEAWLADIVRLAPQWLLLARSQARSHAHSGAHIAEAALTIAESSSYDHVGRWEEHGKAVYLGERFRLMPPQDHQGVIARNPLSSEGVSPFPAGLSGDCGSARSGGRPPRT